VAEDNSEILQEFTSKFIEMANNLANDGESKETVSAALMSASAFYATYAAAGNEGGLTASGVDKMTEMYKSTLQSVQAYKKDQAGQ